MEVCSEHAAPRPDPVGERRTYSHRFVPGVFPQQVPSVCFMRTMLGLSSGSAGSEKRALGRSAAFRSSREPDDLSTLQGRTGRARCRLPFVWWPDLGQSERRP